ncbi:putative neutral sphingomyelinase isoform X2 [Leptidea sinapis]|uniref:putative neutral sphingomyelinase isoform X2 n=1 Tax=Leptidea sinapis TaxID=189913 RepID=UPI0021C3776B|nr:putative neutral sphingomyelinase isoform X2 [Leptidea sinapis]
METSTINIITLNCCGVLGSGLCVFSKWLIQDVFFHQWPLNGYIHKIHHGDWFGGKGVGLCRIKCNDKLINVYCTHLHAEYNENYDIYLAHRVLQAHSTAEFVNLTLSSADISILAGDLNTAPGELPYRLITQMSKLKDPGHEDSAPNGIKAGGTSDNANNSYSNPKTVKLSPDGKRIDHILLHVNNSRYKEEIVSFGNPLEERVPGKTFSYSDHNAVSLELKIVDSSNGHARHHSSDHKLDDTITDAIKVCREAMVTVKKSKVLYLLTGGLIFFFLLGSVGFWPTHVLADIVRIIMSGICFYYLTMGAIWNRIEMNSLKAGVTALENYQRSRKIV